MAPGVTKKKVVVFDDDNHVGEMLQQYCSSIGYSDVEQTQDAKSFFEEANLKEYDLIVVDWAFRGKISAPAIVSRIRQNEDSALTPIIILTGLQLDTELSLAKEYFCTSFIEKPMTSSVFKAAARALAKEKRWYSENYRKIHKFLSDETKDARECTSKLIDKLKTAPNPTPFGILAAEAFEGNSDFKSSEMILVSLLALDPKNVAALSRLARLYCRNKKQQQAYKLLKQADLINPNNPNRLCALGKMELKDKDCHAAQKSFSRALALDGEDKGAKFGLLLAKTLEEQASQQSSLSLSASYASLMNTMGISMVHQGRLEDAVAHYQQALNYLKCSVLKSKVMFNIGLGYLRHKDLEDAHQWFQVSQEEGSKDFNKAGDYVFRLEKYFHNNDIVPKNRNLMVEDLNFLDDDEPLYEQQSI